MKVSISVIRRLNILIIFYLVNILLIARLQKEIIIAKDILILRLQNLEFLIKCQNVSSLTLSEDRVPGSLCRFKIIDLIPSTGKGSGNNKKSFSVRGLSTNWENVLFSNNSSFSSPSLQIPSKTTGLRIFNRKQLRKENLPQEVTEALQWWTPNIKLRNGKSLLTTKPQMLITSNASMKSWRVFCWRHKKAGPWSNLETREHTNVLQLKGAKFAIMKFTKMFQDVK